MGKTVNVVGAGLIGGSVSAGLKKTGWTTYISDAVESLPERAVEQGIADYVGVAPNADVSVLAVPVGSVVPVAQQLLSKVSGPVTDVGSTKADICNAVSNPRFVGGHPMAGSETDGLDGARPDMFSGAIWVLTPNEETDESAVLVVRSMVSELDADMVTLPPLMHDQLVAKVSHVPHLAAAALMNIAERSAVDQRVLLRLAAGGFRDMTRISAGQPTIWPDICQTNKTAIIDGIDLLVRALQDIRVSIEGDHKENLLDVLQTARDARLNLPVGFDAADSLVELSVLIPDKTGQLAAISTLAAQHDINILDLEISHSSEGHRGVLILIISSGAAVGFEDLLREHGYSFRSRSLD